MKWIWILLFSLKTHATTSCVLLFSEEAHRLAQMVFKPRVQDTPEEEALEYSAELRMDVQTLINEGRPFLPKNPNRIVVLTHLPLFFFYKWFCSLLRGVWIRKKDLIGVWIHKNDLIFINRFTVIV